MQRVGTRLLLRAAVSGFGTRYQPVPGVGSSSSTAGLVITIPGTAVGGSARISVISVTGVAGLGVASRACARASDAGLLRWVHVGRPRAAESGCAA
ncbi:hypothetical protein NDU88_000892 [Pleurodeles waltl]|uniref:Uncharacterized protein n=1 Tax=Pleurodeles waltl TaxID=8319 RepID=A0AAV7PB00_PLEWA|nr:hypothetical protein NDU88_000892 [Pleurodeles waltl]